MHLERRDTESRKLDQLDKASSLKTCKVFDSISSPLICLLTHLHETSPHMFTYSPSWNLTGTRCPPGQNGLYPPKHGRQHVDKITATPSRKQGSWTRLILTRKYAGLISYSKETTSPCTDGTPILCTSGHRWVNFAYSANQCCHRRNTVK